MSPRGNTFSVKNKGRTSFFGQDSAFSENFNKNSIEHTLAGVKTISLTNCKPVGKAEGP
jgi:hypothetical protein